MKYCTATTPLLSLATGEGDEEDADAGVDEAVDVLERDLVLVPEAEAIRGNGNTTGLGSLESSRVAADAVVMIARKSGAGRRSWWWRGPQ